MFTTITTAPVTAIRQALRYELGCTFRHIASLTGAHLKTICQSVYAKPGSNVATWAGRSDAQRSAAVEAARVLLA